MTVPVDGPEVPDVVRTADERFAALPGYPFKPNYCEVVTEDLSIPLRMHYVDEGPRDGPVILMVHGEPSWSYLYRKLIHVFAEAGYRAIAVDLIGFGRSDKLTFSPRYTAARHIEWLRSLVTQLDLRGVTLICQDWGGPVGLGVLSREADRFAAVVAGNTILHTGSAELEGQLGWSVHARGDENSEVNKALLDWARHSQRSEYFEASDSLHVATVTDVGPEIAKAWDVPFPGEWHKAGMRQFPLLIPLTDTDEGADICRQTWAVLEQFERPFLTLFSDSDPPTRGWETQFQERVPGAQGQPHQVLERAGHYWQEDCGERAAQIILDWLA